MAPLLLSLMFLATGCSDQGVTAVNASPKALITSHADGDVVHEGDELTFVGVVSDPDQAATELRAVWSLGGQEICGADAPTVDGSTACVATVGPDDTTVSLAVTDPGGAAGVMGVTLQVVPTGAPTVSITAPDADGVYYSDQALALEGVVADEEDAPSDLVVWWESSLDGTLPADASAGADGTVATTGFLSAGQHVLSLKAQDGTDKIGSDSVALTVGPPNTAPTCEILAPTSGSTGAEGALVTFEALVSDPDVTADSLGLSWASDKDGELGTGTPTSTGEVTLATSALSLATHTVSLRVTDDVGATCVDQVTYTVGSAPTVKLVAPTSGEVVNQGAALTFQAEVGDTEDSPTALALSWDSSVDGVFSSQGADSGGLAQFVSSELSAGEHVLTLTVTDTSGMYATALVTFTVNALPSAPTVTLSPDPATTGDTLVATATGSSDPDGSGTVTYAYAWYEAGSLSSASTGATFAATDTTRDLTYRVVVTPSDGTGEGTAGEAELTIANSDPVVDTPVIDPTSGVTTATTLACSASATDPDGDTPAVTFAWSNGSTSLGVSDSLTLTASKAAPGDSITCTATATDDQTAQVSASTAVTVDNTDPTVDSVSISPSTGVTTSSALTCSASASDDDGDSPTLAYLWSIGATTVGTGSTLSLGPTTSAPGDTVTCTATATDGASGTATDSTSVTVDNTAPSVDSVTISPASGVTTRSTLACSATASDPDLETPTLGYAWTQGSMTLGTSAALSLDPSTTGPGDTVTCTVTATDATGDTDSASDSVTVDNSAPSITGVSLSPDPALAADTLSCTYTGWSDPDGDSDASTLAWDVDGTPVGSAATLAGAFVGGEVVTCTVTPSDGSDSGTPLSASLTIDNTAPVLDDVTLGPAPAYEGDTLTCTPGTTADDDGETPTFSYGWDVDGVDTGETGDTLSSTAFDRDETVTCTVTPHDASASGTAVASNSLLVSNTPPVVTSVTVTPTDPSATDTLSCSWSGFSDADGDSDVSTVAWTVNGSSVGTGTTLSTTLSTGDDITCTVTPHDGTDGGTAASDTVSVANAPPVVDSLSLSPSSPDTDDTLTASVSTSDPDGDSVTVTYAWFVDGTELSETSSTLDGGSWFAKDQVVEVQVTPDDGADAGTTVADSVTVVNTAPTAPSVIITPDVPTVGTDDLVCEVDSASTDADGDSLTYAMAWTVDGLTYAAGGGDSADTAGWTGPLTTTWTDDTVAAEDTAAGEVWSCAATPHDGDDDGDTHQASVTLAGDAWSGSIEMPSTDTIDGYNGGPWGSMNGDGRIATRLVLTAGCVNPELAFYQHGSADTSIQGTYYVMDGSGVELDASAYDTFQGCNDCWLPHPDRLSITLDASTTYYLGFQNTTGDMSGPSVYEDANARTVEIATFDDPRADSPGSTTTRGLSTTSSSWQMRWRIDCE
jgi:hypothetical protein